MHLIAVLLLCLTLHAWAVCAVEATGFQLSQEQQCMAIQVSKEHDLVEVVAINAAIVLDPRYATDNNFTGRVLYSSSKIYVQRPVAIALDMVQKELEPLGLGLKIYDGYRPHSVQKSLWEAFPDDNYVANPYTRGSCHSRGCAVDCTLIDLKTGEELAMPSAFDDLTPLAHRDYAAMGDTIAQRNCKLLELVMEKHGFVGVPREWWHFNFSTWASYPILDVDFDGLD